MGWPFLIGQGIGHVFTTKDGCMQHRIICCILCPWCRTDAASYHFCPPWPMSWLHYDVPTHPLLLLSLLCPHCVVAHVSCDSGNDPPQKKNHKMESKCDHALSDVGKFINCHYISGTLRGPWNAES